jgi:adenylate cyclase
MKFTFHVTLLTILLGLIVLTVLGIGIVAWRGSEAITRDLSAQVLEQTAKRIDGQINERARDALTHLEVEHQLLHSRIAGPDDLGALGRHWRDVMRAYPGFSSLAVGFEEKGEASWVSRLPDGRLVVGEVRQNPKVGKLELREYDAKDYPQRPMRVVAGGPEEDARQRPWYVAAKRAGRRAWTDTYVLPATAESPGTPGVSCAVPLHREGGTLLGVLSVSFELDELCQYLRALEIGRNGFAFVLEYCSDGTRQLIGHPDAGLLLRSGLGEDGTPRRTLVPLEEVADARVQGFLRAMPPGVVPDADQGVREVRFEVGGARYLGCYSQLTTTVTPDWMICVVMPEADVLAHANRVLWLMLLVSLAVFLLAVGVSLFVSRHVAASLEQVCQDTEAVGKLDLADRSRVHSRVYELDRLGGSVEEMKSGLRSFQKYVPADLVRALFASGREAELGGERRTLTISFSDLADFTTTSEQLAAEDLVAQLGEYLGSMSEAIAETGGTVDKYIGDAIMAFWGAPAPHPGHALAACTAALQCRARLDKLHERWRAEGRPLLRARTGISTGSVIVGNIGSRSRLNYTVIGDAVNLASRLEGLNKYFGTSILLSETTFHDVEAHAVCRPVDWVAVKGKAKAVLVYELLGLKEQVAEGTTDFIAKYEDGLNRYRRQDWAGAICAFEACLAREPKDAPSEVMLARCRAYQTVPPPPDWDGVFHLATK